MQRVLITGASGFIGRTLTRALLARGYAVRAMTRSPWRGKNDENLEIVQGRMEDAAFLLEATKECDYVIHLAAAKSDEPTSEMTNVEGARLLATACKKNNIRRVIYVSTQSVRLVHRGTYGETKRQAEEVLEQAGLASLVIVRPSLIYGDTLDGVFATLASAVRLPIVPVFGPGTALFRPLHVEDLCSGLIALLEHTDASGRIYDVGGAEEYDFTALLRLLMEAQSLHRPIIHVPLWSGLALAWLLRALPKPPITRSNVLGGAERVPMDPSAFLALLPKSGHSVRTDVRRMFANHDEREEARALLWYVGGGAPSSQLIDRIIAAYGAHAIDPAHRLQRGAPLRLLDAYTRLHHPHCTLQKKLLIAAAVDESQPGSADRLLPRRRRKIAILLALCGIGIHAIFIIALSHTLIFFPSFLKRNAGL